MNDRPQITASIAEVLPLPDRAAPTERVLLGQLLHGDDWGADVKLLQPHMFVLEPHRRIFQAMQLVRADGARVDVVTVKAQLQKLGANESAVLLHNLHATIGLQRGLELRAQNVENDARTLHEEWYRRAGYELATRLKVALASDTVKPEAALLEHRLELDAIERIATGRTSDSRFLTASVTAADLLKAKLEKPQSLIGDGLLVQGGFVLLYGRPGIGKTWAGLQLAKALARGETWYGFKTKQVNVGILSLELPSAYMQDRLRVVLGDSSDADDFCSRIHIVARPELRGSVDVLDELHRTGLVEWCKAKEMDVLIVDALSRVHQVDENSAEKFGQVLAAVDRLREEAGCAVVLLHHEPKARREGKANSTDDDLDAARGTSRLQSDPQTLLRLKRAQGALQLVAAKVNLGPVPAPVWLRATEAGPLEVTDAPPDAVEVGEENRQEVLDGCPGPGEPPAPTAELVAKLERDGLKGPTIKRHLRALADAGKLERSGDQRAGYFYRRT